MDLSICAAPERLQTAQGMLSNWTFCPSSATIAKATIREKMTELNELKRKLKEAIRFRSPNSSGVAESYLDGPEAAFDEAVAVLCRSYLQAGERERRQIEEGLDDNDALWLLMPGWVGLVRRLSSG